MSDEEIIALMPARALAVPGLVGWLIVAFRKGYALAKEEQWT